MLAVGKESRKLVRRLCARALALLVATAFVAAWLSAGSRYYFCPMMDAVFAQPCCDEGREEPHAEHNEGLQVRRSPCCELRVIEALPHSAAANQTEDVPQLSEHACAPPPPTALAMAAIVRRSDAISTTRRATGPPEPSRMRPHSRHMVFLI